MGTLGALFLTQRKVFEPGRTTFPPLRTWATQLMGD